MNSTAGKTEYYRSTDPLENLKFFVSIREVRFFLSCDLF